MDALGDYVWPQATSELILLSVTGLECVGDRLLAGEAWLTLVVLAGEEQAVPLGWGGRTGQRDDAPGRRVGSGLGTGSSIKAGSEVAGTQASPRRAGLERQKSVAAVTAFRKLQPA